MGLPQGRCIHLVTFVAVVHSDSSRHCIFSLGRVSIRRMTEFLCRGYKCGCGEVVQMAQLDKSKPVPPSPESQGYLGGFGVCPFCKKSTFVKPDMWIEWTKEETVH